MIIDETNFLNWPAILINEVVGDVTAFILLGIIIITIFSLYYRVPFSTILIMICFWILVCMTAVYNALFLAIVCVIAALIFSFAFVKKLQRG